MNFSIPKILYFVIDMSASEYIDQINDMSIHDRMLILRSLQESIAKETGPEAVDPVIMEILLKRQKDVKLGKVSSRSWADLRKDLLK